MGWRLPGSPEPAPRQQDKGSVRSWDALLEEDMENLSDEEIDQLLAKEGFGGDEDEDEDEGEDGDDGVGDGDDDDEDGEGADGVATATSPRGSHATRGGGGGDRGGGGRGKGSAVGGARRRGFAGVVLGAFSNVRRAVGSAARGTAAAATSTVARNARRVAEAPKHVLALHVVAGTCRGVRDAGLHAVAQAFVACYLPGLLKCTRVAATIVTVSPVARRAAGFAGVSRRFAGSRIASRVASSSAAAAEMLLPVSPEALADVYQRVAPALHLAERIAGRYAESWIRFCIVRAIARKVAPRQTRRIEYAVRVAPIVAAYAVKKKLISRLHREPARRDAAWERQHRWGARQMESVIHDFGGFYRKVGQICGTAKQMMPDAYLECMSRTMDNNPPVPFRVIKRAVERSLGGGGDTGNRKTKLSDHFRDFDPVPIATASIAQVHNATLRSNGKRVVVKVRIADVDSMVGDVRSMLQTTVAMKRLGLDNGADFPTIFRAYLDVIEGEFDFEAEANKIEEFGALFKQHGLSDRVMVPSVVRGGLSTSDVLVMERVRGTKLLSVLNRARTRGKRPACPAVVAARHANGGIGWDGVFGTMFRAWGLMLLRHGHYHSDPHPGNFILAKDGRLAILDWGQTQVAPNSYRLHLCRLVLAMVAEDYPRVADEVRLHSQVRLERPTTEALAALCYAYFDTRPTPLAEVNMMDLNNSPFLQNKITQNTQEGFFTIRSVFLLRGMMTTCGVTSSMVVAWEEDARATLKEAGIVVPSVMASRGRRMLSRAWLSVQKTFNIGVGARLNTLEAYIAKGGTGTKDDYYSAAGTAGGGGGGGGGDAGFSGSSRGIGVGGSRRGGMIGGGGASPSNDPRRNSALW